MQRRKYVNLYPTGFTSQRGDRFVLVESGSLSAYIPLLLFTLDVNRAKSLLVAAGISMPGSAWRELVDDVASITQFPPRLLADRPGWTGDAFLFPDGELAAPAVAQKPAVAITADRAQSGLAGSLEGWLEGVAGLLAGQHIPMLAIMAAFASPLVELIGRKENFGFEIVGDGSKGKSLSQRLAASVFRDTNLETFNATLAGLESEMRASNGQLLILDEANSFYGERTKGGAGAAMKSFAFRLAGGKPTLRFGEQRPQRYYYVFLTSSNESLASLGSREHQASLRAASDRLMTLNVPAKRPLGVFDHVPEPFMSAEEFAQALDDAADADHGHAMREFIRQLVEEVHEDRERMVAGIRRRIRFWREQAGVGLGSNGAQGRVADAFGLLYAAGELAKRYEVLPDSWCCGHALTEVYRDYYAGPKPPVPIDDAVRTVLALPGVRDIDRQGIRRMGNRLFEATPAFTKRARNGLTEVWLTPANAAQHLPDLPARITSSRAGIRLLREGGHQTVKRQVRTGQAADRMVVLQLPAGFA